jgi:hypothetical protein
MGLFSEKIMADLEAKGQVAGVSAEARKQLEADYDTRIHQVYERLIQEGLERLGKLQEYQRLIGAGDPDQIERLVNLVDKDGNLYYAACDEVRQLLGLPPESKPTNSVSAFPSPTFRSRR